MTVGVFPVPPSVRFPTLTTGASIRLDASHPRSYARFRSDMAPPYSHETGTRAGTAQEGTGARSSVRISRRIHLPPGARGAGGPDTSGDALPPGTANAVRTVGLAEDRTRSGGRTQAASL